ncbi:hypothetical protein GCM10012275_10700 [Longimycelium tulufanense]|uniref:HTH cro/C1-type domain-containing protein n=1 Tax=Longimycelium tulufanense TaxID=907463 RepID=A0A8J3C6L1_9PSEU|nr:helix-turn-helix domain-containing protein [Longimycelium tulufanense]GGM41594.1 hypothetical protein GCM10012275_10700 [Longimycelium tulufanense]
MNVHSVDDEGFRRRAGALLRSAANDLKRNTAASAEELGVTEEQIQEYFSGRHEIPGSVHSKAAAVWPLNERDLLPVRNDCPEGVIVLDVAASKSSSRVFQREDIDYYEYRDTAMSRLASFRPEWIRMLSVVDDDDPNNPNVHWNKGHLLYQFTYFVGPVNYYYRWNGESHVLRMETGDSIWGLPFSPHTFTARNDSEPAYILALTYGGELMGDAQHELAALGPSTARKFAWDENPWTTQIRLLRSHIDAAMLSVAEVAQRSKVTQDRITELVEGAAIPSYSEIESLAAALRVSVRDLLPVSPDSPGGISLVRAVDSRRWLYPSAQQADYSVRQLAGNKLHPYTRALEIQPLRDSDAAAISTHQHQYLYNVGETPMTMRWEYLGKRYEARLAPGDSAYVMPFIPTSFTVDSAPAAQASAARLLALRIAGRIGVEARVALGSMHPGSLERLLNEDRQWY